TRAGADLSRRPTAAQGDAVGRGPGAPGCGVAPGLGAGGQPLRAVDRVARGRVETSFFGRVPGYALIRSLTQRMAGEGEENVWQPVLVELEDALVPAFIVEELGDDRLTVFVPSIPTPFAGAVYILTRDRVHLVYIPLTQAIKSISRWGSGSGDMVAAMRKGSPPSTGSSTLR